MYSSLPVARRTRRGKDLYWKEVWEKEHGMKKAQDRSEKEEKAPREYICIDDSDESEACVDLTGEGSRRKGKQTDIDDDVVYLGSEKVSDSESSEEDSNDDLVYSGPNQVSDSESSEELENSSSEEESSHSDSCGEEDESSEDESSRGSSPYEKKKAKSGPQTQPPCADVDDVESSPGHDNTEAGSSGVNENDLLQQKKAASGDGSGDRKDEESFVVRRKRRWFGMQSVAQPVNKDDHFPSARKCNSGAQQTCSPVSLRSLNKRKQSANTSQSLGFVEDDMNSPPGDDEAIKDVDEANFSGQGRSKGKRRRFKKTRRDETDEAFDSDLEIGTNKLHKKETRSSDQRRNDGNEKTYIGNPETANDVHEKKTGRDENDKTDGGSRGVVNDVEEKETGRAENEETKGGSPVVNYGHKKNKWNYMGKLTGRRSNRENKDCNVSQILVDSIFQKGEGMLEGLAFSNNKASKHETNPPPAETLPQKFSFVTEEPTFA